MVHDYHANILVRIAAVDSHEAGWHYAFADHVLRSHGMVVHPGNAKRREDLLRAGIGLYELKPMAGAPEGRQKVPGPGVGSGLHAKTYAVDRSKIFVGSFTFDQRFAHLNTETGLVIHGAAFAGRLASRVAAIASFRRETDRSNLRI